MTIQLAPRTARLYGTSKGVLQAALNTKADAVAFDDPGVYPETTYGTAFSGAAMAPGASFVVVMDPPTRHRFARVQRRLDGTYQVS